VGLDDLDEAARLRALEDRIARAKASIDPHGGLVIKPMDQFQVKALFGGDISHGTPHQRHAVDGADRSGGDTLIMVYGARGRALVPTRSQSVAEMTYSFIYKMIEDVAGHDACASSPIS
jgi:F-type H+-transporting ATPase subunit a